MDAATKSSPQTAVESYNPSIIPAFGSSVNAGFPVLEMPASSTCLLENAVVAFSNLAKRRAKLATARKTATGGRGFVIASLRCGRQLLAGGRRRLQGL
jgi:hypothetical protein